MHHFHGFGPTVKVYRWLQAQKLYNTTRRRTLSRPSQVIINIGVKGDAREAKQKKFVATS